MIFSGALENFIIYGEWTGCRGLTGTRSYLDHLKSIPQCCVDRRVAVHVRQLIVVDVEKKISIRLAWKSRKTYTVFYHGQFSHAHQLLKGTTAVI